MLNQGAFRGSIFHRKPQESGAFKEENSSKTKKWEEEKEKEEGIRDRHILRGVGSLERRMEERKGEKESCQG